MCGAGLKPVHGSTGLRCLKAPSLIHGQPRGPMRNVPGLKPAPTRSSTVIVLRCSLPGSLTDRRTHPSRADEKCRGGFETCPYTVVYRDHPAAGCQAPSLIHGQGTLRGPMRNVGAGFKPAPTRSSTVIVLPVHLCQAPSLIDGQGTLSSADEKCRGGFETRPYTVVYRDRPTVQAARLPH